ncbi:MAG TPA: CehA/McbA family metallohydrolase [Polyangia bacterium]|jgi:hypothetical protein
MPRRRALLPCLLFLCACGDATTPVPAADRAAARVVATAGDLIGGPKASGQVGDFLLTNTKVRFIIAGAGRTRAWFPVGGCLIDADRVRPTGGEDRLQEMITRLGPFRLLYAEKVEVARDGSDGGDAVVRVTGYDIATPILQSAAPLPPTNVTAVTEYRLAPYAESLEVRTTVTDASGRGASFQAGDLFVMGDFLTLFAPGFGTDHDAFSLAGNLRYLAAFGGPVSYAYMAPGRKLSLLMPQAEVFGIGTERLDVPAHGSKTFTRRFVVGEGDTAGLLPAIVRLEGGAPAALAVVSGTVTEQHTGAAVAGAQVELADGAGPYAIAVTAADGTYRAPLERAGYTTRVSAAGRTGLSVGGLTLPAGVTALPGQDLQVSDTGRYAVVIDDAAGGPCPARLQIYDATGADVSRYLSADGRGGGELPAGDYRAVVSRGYEWDAAEVPFAITAGASTTVAATLARVVDTAGYVAIDSHTHTAYSVDSQLDPGERVAQALADGVELVITTEHDLLWDMAPLARELGVNGGLATALGCEVSPEKGHINGYSLTPGPAADTDGYWPVKWWREDARHEYQELLWPAAIFAALRGKLDAKVVQLNHPRSSTIGVLYWVDYDPARGLADMDPTHFDMNWDVIEVCNAGCDAAPDSGDSRSLHDYYSFLNQGYVRGAVGVSDAHGSGELLGRARTMVPVADDDPAHLDLDEVWGALKAGRGVVLDGAFVTASVRDDAGTAVGIGGLARATGAQVTLHVTVQAPPWIPADHIRVVVNGAEAASVAIPATGDPRPALRFDGDLVLDGPAADAWVVVIVDGDTGMAPVLPGKKPRSITNALFLDRNGNGTFDPPGV